MKSIKIIVIIFAFLFTLAAGLFFAITISLSNDTHLKDMPEITYGYFSFFRLLAIVMSVPATILWLIYFLGLRKK